jgi:hypothetical protein
MKTGVKKYYRKLEDRFEYDEDPNFGKPNFKPSNNRHRRNVRLSNKGRLKAYLKRETNNIIKNDF